MMPDSNFFTARTSLACCSKCIFLCTTPIPPSWAMAMASRASVTVSMADDTIGMLTLMLRDTWELSVTSDGKIWE